MAEFKAKGLPDAAKRRGGYYTPEPIGRFLANWALEARSESEGARTRVLEPSCGDGAILRVLDGAGLEVVGVELDPTEASKASALGVGTVVNSDFFAWREGDGRRRVFDAVVGNPPYIRFGNWDSSSRDRALESMARVGLRPTRLTNAWVPFVVAAVNAVRVGGRVALVLPAELLQVGYAAELRDYLVRSCSKVTLVSFKSLVFPGVLQEIVLLLAEVGDGPAMMQTVELEGVEGLDDFHPSGSAVRASLHRGEKWTRYYLGAEAIRTLRRIERDGILPTVSEFARVNVGVVTGRNSFFVLSQEDVARFGLEQWVIPVVSRSSALVGIAIDRADLSGLDSSGKRTRLLTVSDDTPLETSPELAAYIAEGEAAEVHLGYKTRIRRHWWVVPSVKVPDGFMLRQISSVPRVVANNVGATSTDTVHRVFMTTDRASAWQLATATLNSVTCAFAEVMGRSYGGGILELEPSEAATLPVPDPASVSKELAAEVDRRLRTGDVDGAIGLVDQELLVDGLGMDQTEVAVIEQAARIMRERRHARSKG